MQPITATLPLYPSELRRRLRTAERKLQLQDQLIAQTKAQLALTQHLQTITT